MNDLTNIVPCGIFSFYDNGPIADVNDSFCMMLGYDRDELTGKGIEDLFPVATRIFYQTHLFPLLKLHGHVEEIFILVKTKSQQDLPLLLNARRVHDNECKNVCSCMVVKNRRKYEEEILEAKKAAEKALYENTELTRIKKELQENIEMLDKQLARLEQRNEELRQFGHILSHDLQEPLRKLSVFADMLQKQIPAGSGADSMLQKIFELYQRMRKMVLGLQQFVWLEESESKIAEIDLNEIITGVLRQIQSETKLEFDFSADDLPKIQADRAQLELMFYHLFDNAINYRAPQRKLAIQISASIVQHNKFNAIKDKYKYADFVKINFSDNGSGFDQEHASYVFRLFKRIRTDSEGLGTGLALCKKVADNHYGSINVSSIPDQGSTFTILLPLNQE